MAEKRKDSKGRNLRTGESERKDGRYMFRWTQNGKENSVYALTLGELREKEERIQKDIQDGIDSIDSRSLTINDMYDKWIAEKRGLRSTTLSGYKRYYERHVRNSIGNRKVSAVKYSDIKKFFMSKALDDGLKKGTIKCIYTILIQVFDLAERDNIIRKNLCPMAIKEVIRECYKEPTQKRISLTKQEQDAFLKFTCNHPTFFRWHPLFVTMFGTGCRVGEILALQWEDCDFENAEIFIRKSASYFNKDGKMTWIVQETKTIAGKRTIPMSKDVKKALLDEKERQERRGGRQHEIDGFSNFVFTSNNATPVTPGDLNRTINTILKHHNEYEETIAREQGREPIIIRHFSVHNIRHTFASRLCESTTDFKAIQEIMGHEDVRTTLNIYADATAENKRAAIDNMAGVDDKMRKG